MICGLVHINDPRQTDQVVPEMGWTGQVIDDVPFAGPDAAAVT